MSAAGGRLSQGDVAQLTEQIAGLSRAGLPLASGLRALGQEQPSRRLRAVLDAQADGLDRGESLDNALDAQRHRLPGHLRGLVLAGMRTGKLSDVLGRFVAYANIGSELRRGVVLQLSYPIAAWIMTIGLLTFVIGYIGGAFASIYRDFGVPLAWPTQIVLGASMFLNQHWDWLLEFAAGFGVLALLVLASPERRRNSFLNWVPLLGRVWWFTSLAEFCHLLALLLESDVPLAEALRLSADGVRDSDIDSKCQRMGDDVEAGLSLSGAIRRRTLFPSGLERVLDWAEGNHTLPDALHMLGELFEARAKAQASVVASVTSVLTVIFILFGIGFSIFALMVPMINLITRLSG